MPKITIVKQFTYRDLPEEWSNSYDLAGSPPADEAGWRALAVAIHNSERTCYRGNNQLVAAYGYVDGQAHSVAQIDFRAGANALQAGTLVGSSYDLAWAGDQAGWLRGHVGTSSTGKKVYVRKYFHGGQSSVGDPDELTQQARDAYMAHGQVMKSGSLPGGLTWCAPDGGAIGLTATSRYVTTRTLKRRGKRPTAP